MTPEEEAERELRKEIGLSKHAVEDHIKVGPLKDQLWQALISERIKSNQYRESGLRLEAALSRIDYLLGEPNEMEVSGYDVHCDERLVVKKVEEANKLNKKFDRIDLMILQGAVTLNDWSDERKAKIKSIVDKLNES